MAESHLTDLSFTSLHLPELLQKGLAEASFERCTPIQAQTLPHALAGLDVAGQAQTGTGKTVAFLVALYARLLREPVPADRKLNAPRAVVLAPTRELAVQIHSDAEPLGAHTGLRLGLAFGGIDFEKQKRHLEAGVDVLIGTPGRIIDFYKQHVIDLSSVQVVVLDEADRMFDLGFISDIRYLLRRMPQPAQRLNLLFSATLSQRVLELAYEHMNSPQLVRIEPDKMTVDRVRQVIYYPSNDEKPRLLVGLLKQMDPRRSMVFVNTRRAAEDVELLLRGNGINAAAISGDVPQHKRLRMLNDFHEGSLAVLIGTDVASRGLHIPDVSHVFNYDLPQDPEDYVHRIGRTARAGTDGDAISFGCEEYVVSLPDIEAYINRKIPVAAVSAESLAELQPAAPRPKREHPQRERGRKDSRKPPHRQHGDAQKQMHGHKPSSQQHKQGNRQRTISGRFAGSGETAQPGNQAQAAGHPRPHHKDRRHQPRRHRNERRHQHDRRDQRPQQTQSQRPEPTVQQAGLVQRIGRAVKSLFTRMSSRR
ncbi:MAG TPA: DEAD/DEAH box helicase [Steroidobacteraceae bacterium]|nr:DEAD/DEAH box helicase [Steroidobacteraceae bacterium]